ncbi:putative carboxylesterase 18, partial [Clarias magur]
RDKEGACAEGRFIPEHRRGLNYPAGYDDGADSSSHRLNMLLSVTLMTDTCEWLTSPDQHRASAMLS